MAIIVQPRHRGYRGRHPHERGQEPVPGSPEMQQRSQDGPEEQRRREEALEVGGNDLVDIDDRPPEVRMPGPGRVVPVEVTEAIGAGDQALPGHLPNLAGAGKGAVLE